MNTLSRAAQHREKNTSTGESFHVRTRGQAAHVAYVLKGGASHRSDAHSRSQVSLTQSPRTFSIPQVANTDMNTVFPVKRKGGVQTDHVEMWEPGGGLTWLG